MILLFDEKEQNFDNNGLGSLADAITCEVSEELNGKYELEMTYPVDGIHYSDISLGKFIYTKPNGYDKMQPFRIYSISKPINKIVTVNAEHISYDLSGVTVRGAVEHYAWYVNEIFDHIEKNKITSHRFTFSTNVTKKGEINLSKPRSARSFLGTDDGILSAFGGEFEFDMYSVIHREKRGEDRGVCVEYGKNLTDLKQEENNSSMYTAVYPYYYVEDDGLQYLDDDVVRIIQDPVREKVLPVDLTSEFEEMPTQEQLKEAARKYITDNKLNEPTVSLTVSFIKNKDVIDALQDVRLGDTVTVRFLSLGIDSKSRCISYKYNSITNAYSSIDLGEPAETLSDTVSDISKKQTSTDEAVADNSHQIDSEVDRATEAEKNITVNLEQTAESIRSEVINGDTALSSKIEQTAELIRSEVTNGDTALSSKIEQTAESIRSEVINGDAALSSKIDQTASTIRLEVTNSDAELDASLQLKIDKTDDAQIISMIEGSAQRINFNASNAFTVSSPNFSLDASGRATLKDANFSGHIEATSGYLGGISTTTTGTSISDELHLYDDVHCIGAMYIDNPGSSTAEANARIQDSSGRLAISSKSSQRYKHDIVPVQNYELDPHRLYDINVMQYKYNLDYVDPLDQRYNTDVVGFIAEDVYDKYPVAAEISPSGTIENWNSRYIVPPMLKLVQEQHKQIEQMKFDIMTLKGEINLSKKKEESTC